MSDHWVKLKFPSTVPWLLPLRKNITHLQARDMLFLLMLFPITCYSSLHWRVSRVANAFLAEDINSWKCGTNSCKCGRHTWWDGDIQVEYGQSIRCLFQQVTNDPVASAKSRGSKGFGCWQWTTRDWSFMGASAPFFSSPAQSQISPPHHA